MGASVKVLGTDSSISAAALLLSPHPLRSSSTGILMYPTTEDRPEIAQQAGHQSGRSKNSPKDLLCPATHFLIAETVSRGMRNQWFNTWKRCSETQQNLVVPQ